MPHPHPIAVRLARLEAAYEQLVRTLGNDDVHRADVALGSHLTRALPRFKRMVEEHRAELAAALRAPSVHEIAADMVRLADLHATDTAGT